MIAPDGALAQVPSHNFDPFFRQAVKARELFKLHTLEYSAHSGRYKRPAYFYKYALDLVRSGVPRRIPRHYFKFRRCRYSDSGQLS